MENTENKAVKTKREAVLDRIRGKYPDKDFSDEEALFGQINDDYDDSDQNLAGYKERESKFSDLFSKDPRSAKFLTDWREGQDPAIGLVRMFGTEIKDVIDDPERQEEIAAANKEFVERVAKEKELDETYQKNLDESLGYLEKLQKENGISDDEIDQSMEFLVSIVKDGVMGKFSPESIDLAMKAIKHDADVATAGYEGEVRGKNAKIEEKLRKQQKSDGTAQLDGQNGKGGTAGRMPNLGVLDNYSDGNQSIWERGGESRKKSAL